MFGISEARHFKFGVRTDADEYERTHDRLPY